MAKLGIALTIAVAVKMLLPGILEIVAAANVFARLAAIVAAL